MSHPLPWHKTATHIGPSAYDLGIDDNEGGRIITFHIATSEQEARYINLVDAVLEAVNSSRQPEY